MIEALVDLARAAGECDYLDDRNALLDALEAELDAIHPRLRQRVLESIKASCSIA